MNPLRATTFRYRGKELAFIGAKAQEEQLIGRELFVREEYEPKITKIVKRSQGDVFIDIGAYLGYFSILASDRFQKVFAIEANPLRFGALAYNAGHFSNIHPIWAYAGKNPSPPFNPGHMSGDFFYANNPNLEVPDLDFDNSVVDIESLVQDSDSALIKIDVEGGEGSILDACSTRFLENRKICWIIEVHHTVTDPEYVASAFSNRKLIHFALTRNTSKFHVYG